MKEELTHLISEKEVKVRFSDTDAMGVVWHGNYIKYLEDGREDWGDKYNLSYLHIYSRGFFTPIVEVKIQHKKSLKFGDSAIIRTKYSNTAAAKLIYEYDIYRKSDGELVAKAKSVQVFTDLNENLLLIVPDWLMEWKNIYGLN